MKRKYVYELQYYLPDSKRYEKSLTQGTIANMTLFAKQWNKFNPYSRYRVVQKLGRKIVKVIYPKVKK